MPNTSKLRLTIPVAALLLQLARASVLLEDNVLFHFQASGPVSLATGQNASVCATNLDNSPVLVVIGLLQPDTPSLIAVKQQIPQSGGGTCLNFAPGPNQQGGNVMGLVVPNAQVNDPGGIVQNGPSGGGIAAAVELVTDTVPRISPRGPVSPALANGKTTLMNWSVPTENEDAVPIAPPALKNEIVPAHEAVCAALPGAGAAAGLITVIEAVSPAPRPTGGKMYSTVIPVGTAATCAAAGAMNPQTNAVRISGDAIARMIRPLVNFMLTLRC